MEKIDLWFSFLCASLLFGFFFPFFPCFSSFFGHVNIPSSLNLSPPPFNLVSFSRSNLPLWLFDSFLGCTIIFHFFRLLGLGAMYEDMIPFINIVIYHRWN
ncbi:hypothetical protein I7I48_04720 [Histoplasma ohiense]|nr:hypothetical protein I7I48_04720 [Histoplasma ohiense (nom. inval.)]